MDFWRPEQILQDRQKAKQNCWGVRGDVETRNKIKPDNNLEAGGTKAYIQHL